jgi:transcriptional regulator GlxA family with amidase domain
VTKRRIVLVTFESAQILDVTGPLEVFSCANRMVPSIQYRLRVASVPGGPVTTSCGIDIGTKKTAEVRIPIDTLIVAGGSDMDDAIHDDALISEVTRLAAEARRVTSVCTGSFVLAAAGLLEGRRATTHWREADDFARRYPNVVVEPDAIFVHDDGVWTSAGITAGIDMALALLADDHGQEVAAAVARQLVVYLQRSGGQAQYSTILGAQSAEHEPMRELLAWIREHLDHDLSVDALAARFHLSPRQFNRVFKDEVGMAPAAHVEAIRIESACRLLESTQMNIRHIAQTCGFGTPETLHRVFRRRLDTTPGEYRHHFNTAG